VASLFYTTPTDDGAIAVTCDLCFASVGCPDPWAAAAAITHHRCDPPPAIAHSDEGVPALDGDQPAALHLLAGRWVASCPTCGFQLDPSPLPAPQPPPSLPRLPRVPVMARFSHVRLALDRDQTAALRHLMAAFGVEQVTVTDVQPTSQPDQHPALTQAPAQATLLEEAS